LYLFLSCKSLYDRRSMNRLAHERSPYLLQHAGNPVDWYPWGEEAFARARAEDKPIFLSIGYSTCHWCHVMEHESFENAEVAALLNASFVSIKVDREERPDVDRVYMSFVQSTTGSGGWPMTVFLTPELKPFFGGTYFPPSSRWGRPGFADLLNELSRVWTHDRPRVEQAAGELLERLKGVTGAGGRSRAENQVGGEDALNDAVDQSRRAFDARRGGFGDAPKFPRPSELLFLLREYARRGGEQASAGDSAGHDALRMVTETLRAMAVGGMRDHVGGGFHRYSVDAAWRVPHFEKMLYDQAQVVLAYLEAAQATGDGFFAAVADDTLEYVMRDLTDRDGGFLSAEDADSVPPESAGDAGGAAHKAEGAFYVWSDAEIAALLGDDADVARLRFGIRPEGNAPHDPQGEFKGKNILYIARSAEAIAEQTGLAPDAIVEALGRIRTALFAARGKRPRPHLDDKVLTAWNGLTIAAFARAARVRAGAPASDRYLAAAQRAAAFIRTHLWNDRERILRRRYRDGDAAIEGYAEDYAYLVFGLLELFQAGGDVTWLTWARELQARQDELFWDEEEGGWFSTTGRDASVLLRLKDDYDGAEPAASSVSVLNLLTLDRMLGSAEGEAGRARAERTLARYGPRIGAAARVVPMMLAGLSTFHARHSQIVIVGDRTHDDTRALQQALAGRYLPFAVTIPVAAAGAPPSLAAAMPFVGAMSTRDGRATAYVCRDFVCREPATDSTALAAQLD
jgi:uncharacterized protein YyaL (SSP411 family)